MREEFEVLVAHEPFGVVLQGNAQNWRSVSHSSVRKGAKLLSSEPNFKRPPSSRSVRQSR